MCYVVICIVKSLCLLCLNFRFYSLLFCNLLTVYLQSLKGEMSCIEQLALLASCWPHWRQIVYKEPFCK